jgi:hypothetical protein
MRLSANGSIGEIRHKKERYAGQHEALISREVWDRVQQLRGKMRRRLESCQTDVPRSPLTGKIFEESGEPLYVQGAAKGKRRNRYYVSKNLVRGDSDTRERGWRISAPEIQHKLSRRPPPRCSATNRQPPSPFSGHYPFIRDTERLGCGAEGI